MGTPRLLAALGRAAALLAPAALTGCFGLGEKSTGPEETPLVPTTANVVAVTLPDSVRFGSAFDVQVHRYESCAVDRGIEADWSGDSLYVTHTVMPQRGCVPNAGWPVFTHPPCATRSVRASTTLRQEFNVVVSSANGRQVAHAIRGATPRARGYVQRFLVRRPDGVPVRGAQIVVASSGTSFDTLAVLYSDGDGRAEFAQAGSDAELEVQLFVRTSGSGSEQWHPGIVLPRNIPMRTVILDRP